MNTISNQCIKRTVSQKLTPMLVYIIQKLLAADHKIVKILKGYSVKYI